MFNNKINTRKNNSNFKLFKILRSYINKKIKSFIGLSKNTDKMLKKIKN